MSALIADLAYAERLAVALVMGTAPDPAQASADLRDLNRSIEIRRQAESLGRFRSGEPVQSWPARAPWAGFGPAV